ncbi:hypothetical protein LTR56_010935 [Elasticomyces elasticus]|nr:hypothetical protein LTR56_010935 [Elasticomyces elasticus]KAK3662634.1 hypothetical protein LTR22_006484 [Elasticomyces elasticus]KAK4926582.1 hypothetical protein LTR49_006516 [Elasticomyces elasticus]KAK5760675.1 hypothetical protein LTS12_009212 [Elasticomyces elasticus]
MTDPNEHDQARDQETSMTDKVARYRESHAEASKALTDLKEHVYALVGQARKLVDRTLTVLDALDSGYHVRRLTVAEFGTLEFGGLVEEFVTATKQSTKNKSLIKLREAIVLDSGLPLDNLRAGIAAVSVNADRMVEKAEFEAPDMEDQDNIESALEHQSADAYEELSDCKANTIHAYRDMLSGWAQAFAETGASFKDLEKRYKITSLEGPRFSSNANWEAGLQWMCGMMRRSLGNSELTAENPDYQAAWVVQRMAVGTPLARSVVAD